MRWFLALVTLTAWGLARPAAALDERIDRRIPYQGELTGVAGEATLVVELWDQLTGGLRVWGPESHLVTPDAQNHFVIVIGSSGLDRCARQPDGSLSCPDPPASDGIPDLDQIDPDRLFVRIAVVAGGQTTPLTPRQHLFPAFHSATASAVTGFARDELLGVPIGAVVLWWGSLSGIPRGFELCDGAFPAPGAKLAGRKPDLRGVFPRGAEPSVQNVAGKFPITGGSDQIDIRSSGGTAITISQMPAHTHGVTDPGHSHSITASFFTGGFGGVQRGTSNSIERISTLSKATGISIRSNGGGQAHTHTIPLHDNRPAYLELFYIIRVK